MTDPTPLSPAAQAVLDAANGRSSHGPDDCLNESRWIAAAALRAAADQDNELEIPFAVIDDWERIKGSCASFYAAAEWGYRQAIKNYKDIAAELDGTTNTSESD